MMYKIKNISPWIFINYTEVKSNAKIVNLITLIENKSTDSIENNIITSYETIKVLNEI